MGVIVMFPHLNERVTLDFDERVTLETGYSAISDDGKKIVFLPCRVFVYLKKQEIRTSQNWYMAKLETGKTLWGAFSKNDALFRCLEERFGLEQLTLPS